MRRLITFIGLEVYAVLLAWVQLLGGVRTDEAKYLLDIPYPHPPLVRWILGQTEWMMFQEMFWRVIFATLLIQSVWLVASLVQNLSREKSLALCGFWLLSSAVIFQAGTVMMAPLTALQGLFFVWLFFSDRTIKIFNFQFSIFNSGGWIALFWLMSLFTAYQAILYLPIVFMVFWRMKISFLQKMAAISVPVLLVVLYVVTNPLAMGSFLNAGSQNTALGFEDIFNAVGRTWIISGSIVLSILGTIGMVRGRNVAVILSLFLVVAFLSLSFRLYYAVLFVPLFIAGVISAPTTLRWPAFLVALQVVVIGVFLLQYPFPVGRSVERITMQSISEHIEEGPILISHSFGHQWQYESRFPILRYRLPLVSRANAIVCLEPCSEFVKYGWRQIEDLAMEVWVRDL